ncbi:hypothetical protein ANMWB30_24600 [Arthrobacter sp. MWB30]|nr:hypothetical protein ANMWB30_24600 [Arthrobacter sp. MWB30]
MSIETHTPKTTVPEQRVPKVTVFSKNNCSACDATKIQLIKHGIPFEEINVETDTEPRMEFGNLTPLDYVIKHYDRQMPRVVVDDDTWGDSWSGARYDKILELKNLFEKLGAIIPAEQRGEHKTRL